MAKRGFDNMNATKEVKKKEKVSKAQKGLDDYFNPKIKVKKEKKTFSIDERIVAALRMSAAANDQTLSRVVEKALKKYIDDKYFE